MTSPARLDMFTPIHKALRRLLFETGVALGRTDFESAEETTAAAAAVTACLGFLREHAEHEDRRVMPEVERVAPELAAALALEHPALERAAIAVESLWPRLGPLTGAARAAMGAELIRRFHLLVADQLRHMDREEREANMALWAQRSDAELAEISGRIVADIGPERMAAWVQIIGAAASRPELAAMEKRRNAA